MEYTSSRHKEVESIWKGLCFGGVILTGHENFPLSGQSPKTKSSKKSPEMRAVKAVEEGKKSSSGSEDEDDDDEGALTIVAHEEPPKKRKGTPSPKSRKKMCVEYSASVLMISV